MLTRHPLRDEKNAFIITNSTDIKLDIPLNIISIEKTTEQVKAVAKLEGRNFDKINNIMSTSTKNVLTDYTKGLGSNLLFNNETKENRLSKEYSLGSNTSNSSMDDKEENLNQQEVKELVTPDLETSSFISAMEINDSGSSSGSGGSNEPDSPPILNTLIPIEIERGKNSYSFKRKNSGRSIFSVLSVSLVNKDINKSSLSESEDDPLKVTSPSKSERILGRSGFSSLSMRKRRSKSSITTLDDRLRPLSPDYSKLGSSDIPENTSKVGKLLGLTPMEEKILLDKPPSSKITKKFRNPSSSSVDEKYNDKHRNNNQIISGNSNKINKILGVSNIHDDSSIVDKQNKAGKILGWDDNDLIDLIKKSPAVHMEKLVSDFRSSRTSVNSQVTVASIRNNLAFTGHLSRHTNTNFVLSKSKSWKKRYFILAKNTLYCFKSSDSTAILMDSLELTANTVVCVSDAFTGRSWVLELSKGQKPWYLQADNVDDLKLWLEKLKSTVIKCKYRDQELPDVPNVPLKTIDDEDEGDDIFVTPKASMEISHTVEKSSEGNNNNKIIEQISLPPPPRPTPPPPRSKSSTSRSPSPTSTFSSSTHPLSPHLIVNGDVDEFIGSPKKLVHPPRSSSPVSTLSPPRTRYGQVISNEHLISTDPNDSQHSSHLRTDSGPINTKLSINTNTQFRQQRLIPPTRRTDERNSIRQSIPIMMPTSLFKTSTSSSTLNKHNILVGTSLPPPPRSLYRVPIHLPPSIPLPLPPPRPKSTMTQNSVPRLPQITPRISKDTSMKSPTRSSSHSSNSMYHVNQLPPPSRPPPTIPLPPIPVESTKNVISNEIIIEFPDEDDLDPDYAEELEASRRRSQKMGNI